MAVLSDRLPLAVDALATSAKAEVCEAAVRLHACRPTGLAAYPCKGAALNSSRPDIMGSIAMKRINGDVNASASRIWLSWRSCRTAESIEGKR